MVFVQLVSREESTTRLRQSKFPVGVLIVSVWKACKGKDEVVERKEGVGFEAFFMGNRPSACSLCAAVVEFVLIVVMVCRWLGCISSG